MEQPDDLDLVTRTVLAEAGNQGPVGMAAVAAVIKNRMQQRKLSPSDVVLQHNQFEPWNANHIGGPNDPMRFSPEDPRYRQAQEITQRVMRGELSDPTRGATHFANVGTVRQRNGGTVGNHGWISPRNETARIGGHTFFAPEGRVMNGFNTEMASEFWRNPTGGGMPGLGGGVTGSTGAGAGTPDVSASTPQMQPMGGAPRPGPQFPTSAGGAGGAGGGSNPPVLGRLLFGDGGLNGFLKTAIPTPFGGQGLVGGAMNGIGSALGGAGASAAGAPMVLPGVASSMASAAPALASAAPAAAGAAGAGAAGLGSALASLLAFI